MCLAGEERRAMRGSPGEGELEVRRGWAKGERRWGGGKSGGGEGEEGGERDADFTCLDPPRSFCKQAKSSVDASLTATVLVRLDMSAVKCFISCRQATRNTQYRVSWEVQKWQGQRKHIRMSVLLRATWKMSTWSRRKLGTLTSSSVIRPGQISTSS